VQQGVCQYRGKWYLAYHLPYDNVAPYNDHHRQVAVTQLEFNADGSLRAVNPDRDPGVGTPGVTSLSLDAFASRRESAEFHLRTKAEATPALAGEYAMKMKDGGYLQFEKMDFGEGGAAEFHLEVKSDVVTTQDSSLEVRLDNPAGQLITTVSIGGGSGEQIIEFFQEKSLKTCAVSTIFVWLLAGKMPLLMAICSASPGSISRNTRSKRGAQITHFWCIRLAAKLDISF
jgi:hypothetical protein